MTMRGTPYYYNGDELGMTNIGFTDIKDYRDVQILNAYQHEKNIGGDLKKFMKREASTSRDNSRTPFQWEDAPNAGFTTGTPWIKVNPNYKTINEEAENNDPNSVLNYFRKVVRLRKDNLVLVYGKYELLDKANSNVYAYTRTGDGEKLLIVLNFTTHNADANIGIDVKNATMLLSNYKNSPLSNKKTITLRPYQAVIYRLPM